MVRVEHNGKSYEIPGVLDELTPDQYKGYLFLAVMLRRGIIDEMGFKAKLLAELMGLGVDITDFKPDVAEGLIAQLGVLDGFLDENGPITATGRNLLPEFAGWKSRVGDMLNGLAFGEFVEGLTLLGRLDDDEETQQAVLNELARLLYSPPEDKADTEVPALVAVHSVTFFTSVFNMIRKEPIGINLQAGAGDAEQGRRPHGVARDCDGGGEQRCVRHAEGCELDAAVGCAAVPVQGKV